MQVNYLQKIAGRWTRVCAIAGAMLGPVVAQAQTPTTIHLEAENAILHGPSLLTATPGYSGTGYVGEFDNGTDSVIFRFPTQAGRYRISVRYTSPTANKTTNLAVNGTGSSIVLTRTGPAFGTLAAGSYPMPAGTSTVAIAAGQGYFGIDYIEVTPIPTQVVTLVNGRAEAEDGFLNGVTVANSPTGFSGAGFVTGFDNSDAKNVDLSFNIATPGLYQVTIGYTSPYGLKVANVIINGDRSTATFTGTSSTANFSTSNAGTVLLSQGLNNIVIGGNYGYYGIDYIQLTPTTVALPVKPPKHLNDAQAIAPARGLLSYLTDLYGTKTLSGQADDRYGTSNSDVSYVLATTGKEPAIAAMDLFDYSTSPVAQYGQPNGITERYLGWATSGNGRGITSLIWHWRAPTDLVRPNDPSGAFYTVNTTFNIAAVLADTTGSRYQLLLNDIDLIAVQLRKFQTAGVPVLWRPLHESPGTFFWWNAQGPAAFKSLWRLMYRRLTYYNQLHNLIWVYCANGSPDAAWYPGDGVVDITGTDIYQPPTSNMSSTWTEMQTQFAPRRLVALTETGNPPDPDKIRAYATWWSWFASWSGQYVRNQPVSFLTRVYNDRDIITKDELANWATMALATRSGAAATAAGLSVYPNPASGYAVSVQLRSTTAQEAEVQLINTLGQRVRTLRARLVVGDNLFQVPLAGATPGVYQLVVRLPGQPALSQRVLVAE